MQTRTTSISDRIYAHFGMTGLSEAGKLTNADYTPANIVELSADLIV